MATNMDSDTTINLTSISTRGSLPSIGNTQKDFSTTSMEKSTMASGTKAKRKAKVCSSTPWEMSIKDNFKGEKSMERVCSISTMEIYTMGNSRRGSYMERALIFGRMARSMRAHLGMDC
jgi:hypothetical protein